MPGLLDDLAGGGILGDKRPRTGWLSLADLGQPRQEEARAFGLSLRERLAAALMGDTPSQPRRDFVSGLVGSTGLGSTGMSLADLTPLGSVFGAQDAYRAGDPQGMMLSAMPMGPAKRLGPVIWRTVDGGAITEPESAFRLARELAEQAGFKLHGASGQSRSTYYQMPGHDRTLRISDHGNYHPGRNNEVIEARLRTKRDEVEHRWTDPREGEIVEREFRNGILDSPDEIAQMMRQAIADYLKR